MGSCAATLHDLAPNERPASREDDGSHNAAMGEAAQPELELAGPDSATLAHTLWSPTDERRSPTTHSTRAQFDRGHGPR